MLKFASLLVLLCVHHALAADNDWYKTASFYQIYPQTFYDGGGGDREGYGTFRGIQEKIPYFKELGIDCLWLTPVFESAFNAFGYDITDYEKIDMRYGTMEDFESLIKAVHDNGMKIIVDFVPNHCSYLHPFFQLSLAKNETYANWFVWVDGKGENKTEPPSNWQRIGGAPGSGWNRHINDVEINRTDFFFAQFYWSMPDLNLREPAVAAYWVKFLKMWLDIGLDGFRIDAISHGFEKEKDSVNGTLPDEPTVEGVEDETNFGYLDHIYTTDQPELFEMIYDWRDVLDQYNDSARIFMTESYSPPATVMKFYRNANNTRKGAQLPFNFELIRVIQSNSTADTFVNTISSWFALLPEGEVTNWAIGNHDQSRVATRFGAERVDIFNTLCTMLPGTSVTYYGEEIGMKDSCVYYDADRNKPGHRCNATENPSTDAKYRTPMQWSNSTNGGFTNSSKPWLPIGDDYQTLNVKAQQGIAGSHLEIYKSLQAMRRHKAIKEGSLSGFGIVKLGANSFGFKRELSDAKEQSLLVLINYGSAAETVDIRTLNLTGSPDMITFKVVGHNSTWSVGEEMSFPTELVLNGFESVVVAYNHAFRSGGKIFTVVVVVGILSFFMRSAL